MADERAILLGLKRAIAARLAGVRKPPTGGAPIIHLTLNFGDGEKGRDAAPKAIQAPTATAKATPAISTGAIAGSGQQRAPRAVFVEQAQTSFRARAEQSGGSKIQARLAAEGVGERHRGGEQSSRKGGGADFGVAARYGLLGGAITGAARTAEHLGPMVRQALLELLPDQLAPLRDRIEAHAARYDAEISKILADMTAIFPAISQTRDRAHAQLVLGSSDADINATILADFERARNIASLQAQLQKRVERDLDRNTAGALSRLAQEAFGR